MNPVRLIIADPSAAFVNKAADIFRNRLDIQLIASCSSGAELLRLCHMLRPDAVLTDVILEDIDGLCVMKELSESYTSTAFIVCTAFCNDISICRAHKCGASCFLCKPVDSLSLCSTICESVATIKETFIHNDDSLDINDSAISDILAHMGILKHYEGFELIRCAVKNILVDPSLMCSLTKHLYPKLAKSFNSTPARVERNIRTAISKAHSQRVSKLTNRELLKLMIEELNCSANII